MLSRRGRNFIADAVKAGQPFMLKLSPYAPHYPYTPAPRDAQRFPDLQAPRGTLFDAPQLEGSPVVADAAPARALADRRHRPAFRKRAQSVVAIDRMIAAVRAQLRQLGVAHNTYIVFTSDNGFHTGQRRMLPGKQTYWDHDIRVPLIVVGPGVPAGASVCQRDREHRPAPDVPGARGGADRRARRGPQPGAVPARPGAAELAATSRSSSTAARTGPTTTRTRSAPARATRRATPRCASPDALYVEYDNPTIPPEYYDHARDPLEQRNVYGSLTSERQAELAALLSRLRVCSGGPSCQAADS